MSPTKHEPRITVRLSDELAAQLKAAAASRGIKPGTLVREALEAALAAPGGSGPRSTSPAAAPASPRASESSVRREVAHLEADIFDRHLRPEEDGKRTCSQCGKKFGSPTLRRCGCGGKILPEPE